MKNRVYIIFAVVCLAIFSSCENVTSKVETQLNQLNIRADQLDSVINTEMDKVMKLDSVINLEDLKIRKLDSIAQETTSKFDSIWKTLNW